MDATETKITYRQRLLEGLAESIREKGLQRTQISDIVRHARTSRRTFYECFPDKESCFVEMIRASNKALVAELRQYAEPDAPWEDQVDGAVDAYLAALTADPAVTASISRELPTLGERGAALQHEGVELFAELVVAVSRGPALERAGIRPMTTDMAIMLVGGIAELIARAAFRREDFAEIAPTAKAVIKAALVSPDRA
jgi:AcrR family transcriptional regulator